MAESRRRHRWHYRPDEIVIAVQLPEEQQQPEQAHARVREALEQQLAGGSGGLFSGRQSRQSPIVFRAEGKPPLAFLFFELEQADHANAKKAVHDAQSPASLDRMRESGFDPLGIMPHWLGSAMQDFSGGSPATLPRPTRPRRSTSRWRRRHTATDRGLDFRDRLARGRGLSPVPVLVLDTPPDWGRAQRQARRFADMNAQLPELLEFLGDTSVPGWHADALLALDRSGLKLARTRTRRGGHDISDHALFIAGLIHDLAPTSQISLRPVLNRFGVGDLHLLLQVLADVTGSKPREQPMVINMSLGFLPRLEYLPWIWYGVQRPNDPDFAGDVAIRDEPRDQAWLIANRGEVNRTRDLLHGGLDLLGSYLLANNCFAVAAAGNDSLSRVERGGPRFGPRFPARDEAVLGVAATTANPDTAADYSNVGEAVEIGDHIATFGGGVRGDTDTPRDGVIGVYTAPNYPGADAKNDNGWAEWSGTSFSTAIASGLVAGYWTVQRAMNPNLGAAEVLSQFHGLAPHYAPALRTASIAVEGEWERVPR
jgi:subtilase family protein